MNDVKEEEMNEIITAISNGYSFKKNGVEFIKEITNSLQYGYALLKGKERTYSLKKLNSIIGRRNHIASSNIKWKVDINLKKNFKVSKQHALIMYNFEDGVFEIKCISEKYPIKVNNISYYVGDEPVSLDNGTLITIGGEHFYFLLPKQ